MIDAIICSIDDGKFAAACRSLEDKLSPFGLRDIIRIPDATSMTEGYNRGIDRSDADWLIFCHDDISILYLEPASFRRAFDELDVFGIAGATSLRTANWYDATPDRLAGTVVVPGFMQGPDEHGRHAMDPRRFDLQLFGRTYNPIVPKACALDGVFIAARRTTCEALGGWNERIAGWNGYDLDFSWRASQIARVGILTTLVLLHTSRIEFFGSKKVRQWFDDMSTFERRWFFDTRHLEREPSYVKHQTIVYDHLPTEAELAKDIARHQRHPAEPVPRRRHDVPPGRSSFGAGGR